MGFVVCPFGTRAIVSLIAHYVQISTGTNKQPNKTKNRTIFDLCKGPPQKKGTIDATWLSMIDQPSIPPSLHPFTWRPFEPERSKNNIISSRLVSATNGTAQWHEVAETEGHGLD